MWGSTQVHPAPDEPIKDGEAEHTPHETPLSPPETKAELAELAPEDHEVATEVEPAPAHSRIPNPSPTSRERDDITSKARESLEDLGEMVSQAIEDVGEMALEPLDQLESMVQSQLQVDHQNVQRGALAGGPINASYAVAAALGTPEDANWLERLRDRTLGFFVRFSSLFDILALLAVFGVLGFGVLIAISIFPLVMGVPSYGTDGTWNEIYPECRTLYLMSIGTITEEGTAMKPPRGFWRNSTQEDWAAGACTHAQFFFTTCIKGFTFIFSYINFLPIPWRLSIFNEGTRRMPPQVRLAFCLHAMSGHHSMGAGTCGRLASRGPHGRSVRPACSLLRSPHDERRTCRRRRLLWAAHGSVVVPPFAPQP